MTKGLESAITLLAFFLMPFAVYYAARTWYLVKVMAIGDEFVIFLIATVVAISMPILASRAYMRGRADERESLIRANEVKTIQDLRLFRRSI